MFSKAHLVSTLVATIWGMAGGFLLWGIIADPLMKEHMTLTGLMKEEIDMVFLPLGTLVQAFAFSYIYSKWGQGNYGMSTGLSFGLWMAILIGLGEKLVDYATANMMNLTGTLMNFVVYVVFFGVMGLLVGLIYKKMA